MKFTESHEWIKVDGDIGTVGITHHAQKELGKIDYLELPAVGKQIKAKEEVAILESTKAAADISSPVSGEIVQINQQLHEFIQKINTSPEKEGWLFKIRLTHPEELATLLSQEEYLHLVGE